MYGAVILKRGYVLYDSSYEIPDFEPIWNRELDPSVMKKLFHVPNADLDYLFKVTEIDGSPFSDVLVKLFQKTGRTICGH